MTVILGINAYHGDSSACLVLNGILVAAAEEERFRRIKHWAGFPSRAIRYCLEEAGVGPQDLDHVALSRNPRARLAQKTVHVLARRPGLSYVRDRLSNLARLGGLKQALCDALEVEPSSFRAQFHHVGHHLAHVSSAFLVSPYEEAAVVSIDGFGDFASTMTCAGRGTELKVLKVVGFPHSVGMLYTALTQYLGFPKYGDEYKVMGLAAYGQPEYLDELQRMIVLREDGTFQLDLNYFRHHSEGVDMTWDDCEPTLGRVYSDHLVSRLGPPRQPDEPIAHHHENVAASLQARLEEVFFHVMNGAHRRTGHKALCVAGGVAFNSVANGKIFDKTPFEEVYIQAAAGDAGTAVGAAYHVHHRVLKQPRAFVMDSAFWGPHYTDDAVKSVLKSQGLGYQELDERSLLKATAQAIADGKVVGWFQGRMEWGPRALGNRSILADPRREEMKDTLNARIKRREPFRPFAPSILLEAVGAYFEKSCPDPFMIKVYPIKPAMRHLIPAVTHVDGTGRLQTVSRESNPRYWGLIKEFEALTGVPAVLNTSFNENEPIVCSPNEAIACFTRTHMDFLALGNLVLQKEQ